MARSSCGHQPYCWGLSKVIYVPAADSHSVSKEDYSNSQSPEAGFCKTDFILRPPLYDS